MASFLVVVSLINPKLVFQACRRPEQRVIQPSDLMLPISHSIGGRAISTCAGATGGQLGHGKAGYAPCQSDPQAATLDHLGYFSNV